MSVPNIAVLRERAATIIARASSGQMRAMLAGICAAKNTGDPLPADSTGQELITQCQGIIDQAESDALAIFVRELMEFVENATTGGGGDAPSVTAPFPAIGDEGEIYSQQIHTTGSAPQTFSVTSGAIPTGHTLGVSSGIIFGQCDYPNGGLYTGTIHVSNAYGSVDYNFEILVNGVAPTISYPTITPYNTGVLTGAVLNSRPCTLTGSTGGYPSVPITVAFISAPDPLLNATLDTDTGDVTMTPDESLVGNYVPDMRVQATNYFGSTGEATPPDIAVVANIYYGEWHGALPGSFTSDNITIDVFDNLTPGPRVKTGASVGMWIAGEFAEYPATAIAYYRILAVPHGMLIGNIATQQFPIGTIRITDFTSLPLPCPDLTPAWPTPYQSGLVISGVEYDVYVVNSRTASIELFPYAA